MLYSMNNKLYHYHPIPSTLLLIELVFDKLSIFNDLRHRQCRISSIRMVDYESY